MDLFWLEDHNKANDIDRLLIAITVFYLPHILYAKNTRTNMYTVPEKKRPFFSCMRKNVIDVFISYFVFYLVFLRCKKPPLNH